MPDEMPDEMPDKMPGDTHLGRFFCLAPGVCLGKRFASILVGIVLVTAPVAGRAATPPPLRVGHAAVASDNAQASAAGVAALKAGGNAVDAACATALALGVLHPFASGIGGGGFALVYRAKEHSFTAIDFRERAPGGIRPELFVKNGKADPKLSREGGLAVGVPGEVRGLGTMVRRWGKLPFSRCVTPAEQLARGLAVCPGTWRKSWTAGARDPNTSRCPTSSCRCSDRAR